MCESIKRVVIMESYSNKLIVVMYHYVRDLKNSRYPNIKGLTIEQFREQIEFISNNFNVIDMERFLEAKYTNLALPDNLILLTFDDGYIDHYTNVYPKKHTIIFHKLNLLKGHI
jgi:hypothetical protein